MVRSHYSGYTSINIKRIQNRCNRNVFYSFTLTNATLLKGTNG